MGQSEIAEFHFSDIAERVKVQENVPGFDVAVDQVLGVHVRDSLKNLPDNKQRFLFFKLALLSDVIVEGGLHKFLHQIEVGGAFENVD